MRYLQELRAQDPELNSSLLRALGLHRFRPTGKNPQCYGIGRLHSSGAFHELLNETSHRAQRSRR